MKYTINNRKNKNCLICKKRLMGLQKMYCCRACLDKSPKQLKNRQNMLNSKKGIKARKETCKQYRNKHLDKINEYQKQYRQSELRKEVLNKYAQKYPERIKARMAIQSAVRNCSIPKARTLKCKKCGTQANEYDHHKGYKEKYWLDVIPLCRSCHYKMR